MDGEIIANSIESGIAALGYLSWRMFSCLDMECLFSDWAAWSRLRVFPRNDPDWFDVW